MQHKCIKYDRPTSFNRTMILYTQGKQPRVRWNIIDWTSQSPESHLSLTEAFHSVMTTLKAETPHEARANIKSPEITVYKASSTAFELKILGSLWLEIIYHLILNFYILCVTYAFVQLFINP